MNFIWRYIFILTILVAIPIQSSWAQRHQADSLRRLLKTQLSNQQRVEVLNQLAYELYDFEDSAAYSLAHLALKEATEANYANGIKYAHTLIGLGNLNMGNYAGAIASFKKSEAVKGDTSSKGTSGYNLTLLGNMYRDLGQYDSSRYYYYKAIDVMGEGSGQKNLATTYKNIAQLDMLLWQNEKAILLLEKAERIAAKDNDTYLLIDIWTLFGKVYENLLNFEKANTYFEKMCSSAHKEGDLYHLIMCDLNNAEFTFRRGDLSASLEYCFSALKKSEIYYYPPQRAEIYLKIGEVYEEFAQYEMATRYFFEVLKITEKLGLDYITARTYSELAWIYKNQNDYALALDYINRSETLRKEMGDQHGIANCYNVRGMIFYQQKKYDLAIDELEESLRIREAIHHTEGASASMYNLSLVYEDLNQLNKALELQQKAIAIEEGIENKQSLGISYNSVSALLIKLNRLTEAEAYLKKAQQLAEGTNGRLLLRDIAKMHALLYEKRGDYKMAWQYQLKFQELNDSIYSEGSAVKMSEMQALYQLEQKDQEIDLLNKDVQISTDQLKLQQSKIEQQQIIIFSALAGFLSICFMAFKTYRYNRSMRTANMAITEQKEELQAQSEEITEAYNTISEINRNLEIKIAERTTALRQAYTELDTFFYRASHDFRRPLTTFMGLAEVANITLTDPNALELFAKVKETASNLDKMLVKLQSISDVGAKELVFKEVSIKEIFDSVCETYKEQLASKKIKTFCEIEVANTFFSYPAMVKIIIDNLVENSIAFCATENPIIKLKVYEHEGFVRLEMTDNGLGIDPKYYDRIFNMYFRGNELSKGNGLGLFIVKKSVQKLGGTVTFTSQLKMGSTFTINLPRNRQHVEVI